MVNSHQIFENVCIAFFSPYIAAPYVPQGGDLWRGTLTADEDLFIGVETKAFIKNAELPVPSK